MRNHPTNWNRWIPVFCLTALLLGLSTPVGATDGDRVVTRLAEPFEINGQIYQSGVLAIRQLGPYNPSSTLVEISVNNTRVGLLLAQVVDDGERQDVSTVLFARSARGHLMLVGFTDRAGSRNAFYTFRADSDGGRWLPPAPRDANGLLLASR